LTPPKNLSPVSLTPLNSFVGGVVDTGDKFHAFWFLMTGINDTGEKTVLMTEVCSCCKTISGRRSRPRPPILSLEGPGGRQSYFKPKRHYLVLAASGASDQDVWGVFGCNFSWRFQ
jgi:hypothetical protein